MPDLAPILDALGRFFAQPPADSTRLFHGRGGCHPGLNWCAVDAFAPVLLVTLYEQPPEGALAQIEQHVRSLLPCTDFSKLVVQHRYLAQTPYQWLIGDPIADGYATRGGERFLVRYSRQNVGFFLDMEPGRRWLEQRAQGARVLNLFSYTCAFSVVAQAAGASQVVNVDMSKSALTTGRENHRVNGLPTAEIQFLPLDILKSWSRIRKPGPYDIIIIDPPSFQKGSFIAQRDYAKVIRRLPELVAPGANVLACLNAPELDPAFLVDLIENYAPGLSYVQRLPAAAAFEDVDPRRQLKLMHFQAGA